MANKPSPHCQPFTERMKGEGGMGICFMKFHQVSPCRYLLKIVKMYTIMLPCGSPFCECKVVECTKHFSMQCLNSHTDRQLIRIQKSFARTVANCRTHQVGKGCIYVFIRQTTSIYFFLCEGCKSDHGILVIVLGGSTGIPM